MVLASAYVRTHRLLLASLISPSAAPISKLDIEMNSNGTLFAYAFSSNDSATIGIPDNVNGFRYETPGFSSTLGDIAVSLNEPFEKACFGFVQAELGLNRVVCRAFSAAGSKFDKPGFFETKVQALMLVDKDRELCGVGFHPVRPVGFNLSFTCYNNTGGDQMPSTNHYFATTSHDLSAFTPSKLKLAAETSSPSAFHCWAFAVDSCPEHGLMIQCSHAFNGTVLLPSPLALPNKTFQTNYTALKLLADRVGNICSFHSLRTADPSSSFMRSELHCLSAARSGEVFTVHSVDAIADFDLTDSGSLCHATVSDPLLPANSELFLQCVPLANTSRIRVSPRVSFPLPVQEIHLRIDQYSPRCVPCLFLAPLTQNSVCIWVQFVSDAGESIVLCTSTLDPSKFDRVPAVFNQTSAAGPRPSVFTNVGTVRSDSPFARVILPPLRLVNLTCGAETSRSPANGRLYLSLCTRSLEMPCRRKFRALTRSSSALATAT